MAKTVEQLREDQPIIEVDDFHAGFAMASDVASCFPELKAHYLAQWAARLRVYYVGIGREAAGTPIKNADEMRQVLEWLDRRGGLGLDVHNKIRVALGKPRID